MDPQKNPLNPTQDDADQQPAASQAPATDQIGGVTPEVTVDFNQNITPGTNADTGPGDMPPIGGTGTASAPQQAAPSAGMPGDAFTSPPQQGIGTADSGFSAGAGIPGSVAAPDSAGIPPVQPQAPPPQSDPFAGAAQPAPGTGFPDPNAAAPVQSSPSFAADQTGVPPVAPVPAAKADKKTIFILVAVAVVLIAAIAVLFFM